jgi:hypothetical protein
MREVHVERVERAGAGAALLQGLPLGKGAATFTQLISREIELLDFE